MSTPTYKALRDRPVFCWIVPVKDPGLPKLFVVNVKIKNFGKFKNDLSERIYSQGGWCNMPVKIHGLTFEFLFKSVSSKSEFSWAFKNQKLWDEEKCVILVKYWSNPTYRPKIKCKKSPKTQKKILEIISWKHAMIV